jgi:hypothetical protein
MTIHLPTARDRDDWQLAIWNLPDDFVSRAQKLQLMTMLEAGFNDFDPFRVVSDLLRHRELWRGAVMDRDDLIKLRDVEGGHWSVDTLYLLIDADKEAAVLRLAEGWSADELHAIAGRAVGSRLGTGGDDRGRKIVRVWWD